MNSIKTYFPENWEKISYFKGEPLFLPVFYFFAILVQIILRNSQGAIYMPVSIQNSVVKTLLKISGQNED